MYVIRLMGMDLPQILLLVVIVVISVILVVIGVQIIGLLRDAKETLKKTDAILDDLGFLSRTLTRSGGTIGHMVSGLESGVQLVGMLTKLVAPKSKK